MLRWVGRWALCGFLLWGAPVSAFEQDPLESYNRWMYGVNRRLDRGFARPIAQAYAELPRPVRTGVRNFFQNLTQLPLALNHALQGEGKQAWNDLVRFGINSTFGLGGVFDLATPKGYPRVYTDFGLTLVHMGCRSSAYLVLPLLGPTTFRDLFGEVVDWTASVRPYWPETDPAFWGMRGLEWTERRAEVLAAEGFLQSGFDEYAAVRSSYLQRRAFLMGDTEAGLTEAVESDESFND